MLKLAIWADTSTLSQIQRKFLEAEGYEGRGKRVLLGTQRIHLVSAYETL
jgi:hypothetical protein